MKDIWVEKYRPKTVDEYVFKDEAQKHQVKSWIAVGGIPHLLFSGSAGTGKTTLAKGPVKRFNMEKALLQRDIVPRRARTQNGRAPPQPCDGTREMPVGVGSARPSSVGAATGAWRRLTRWTRGD